MNDDNPRPSRDIPWAGILTAVASLVAIVGALALVVWFPLSTDSTPQGKSCLVYEGGMMSSKEYSKTVPVDSGRYFAGWMSKNYCYPMTKRSYIVAEQKGADLYKRIKATSKDNLTVRYEVAMYFTINDKEIRPFHEDIGRKYEAWDDEGWDKMLKDTVYKQIETSLTDASNGYDAVDVYTNPAIRKEMSNKVRKDLEANMKDMLGGDNYFCGPSRAKGCSDFTFTITRALIPGSVVKALEKNKTSAIAVQTKENEIKQNEAEARAIAKIQTVLESCGQICVMNKAVEQGKIDFWVMPSGTTVSRNAG